MAVLPYYVFVATVNSVHFRQWGKAPYLIVQFLIQIISKVRTKFVRLLTVWVNRWIFTLHADELLTLNEKFFIFVASSSDPSADGNL